jgi:hypothetical protein
MDARTLDHTPPVTTVDEINPLFTLKNGYGETLMSLRYLKIKIKSLAAESTMIRQEEQKAIRHARTIKSWQGYDAQYGIAMGEYFGLKQHRDWDVRNELKGALLAYNFIRGKPFNTCFPNCKEFEAFRHYPNGRLMRAVGRATTLVKKYGGATDAATGDDQRTRSLIIKWIIGQP